MTDSRRVPPGRRLAGLVVAAGLAGVILVQLPAPARLSPLLDGVVVEEPYRFAQPSPGQAGDPGTADETLRVSGGLSPGIATATPENPPQAQVLAAPGAFDVGAAGSVRVTIAAVPSGPLLPGWSLAGNVYRVSVIDDRGRALPIVAGTSLTIVLRAPLGTRQPAMVRRTAEGWAELPTTHTGLSDLYLSSMVTQLGEFALVAVPSSLGGGGGGWPAWIPLAVALVVAATVAFLAWRESSRSSRRPPAG